MNRRDDSVGRWWDRSWTLVRGCSWPEGEMPPACEHCWARGMAKRFRPGELRGVLPIRENLGIPRRTKRPTVFAVQISYGDLFHPLVPDGFIVDALAAMDLPSGAQWENPHKFVLLTKRPRHAAMFLPTMGRPHVWLLASCWDQRSADEAVEALAGLPRWGLHLEPLLGPIDLAAAMHWECTRAECGQTRVQRCSHCTAFDCCDNTTPRPAWIVVGGENGPGARPMDPGWVRMIRDQCASAGVPFYLKSLGDGWLRSCAARAAEKAGSLLTEREARRALRSVHRILDGQDHNEVPW